MKSPSDDLKTRLAAWRIEPEFRPDFNREVWRKIAAGNAARRENFWQTLFASLFEAPRYATVSALAVAMMTISLGTAHLAARTANAHQWTALEERYAQSIDPLTRSSMKE
ncbi:MAG: hypothetical protein WCH43_16170 [Verrucomicrobiota bacterium]